MEWQDYISQVIDMPTRIIQIQYMRAADLAAPRLYAGYETGYYCVRIKGDIELATLLPLQAKGYRLRFLQPPASHPVLLKRRIK